MAKQGNFDSGKTKTPPLAFIPSHPWPFASLPISYSHVAVGECSVLCLYSVFFFFFFSLREARRRLFSSVSSRAIYDFDSFSALRGSDGSDGSPSAVALLLLLARASHLFQHPPENNSLESSHPVSPRLRRRPPLRTVHYRRGRTASIFRPPPPCAAVVGPFLPRRRCVRRSSPYS